MAMAMEMGEGLGHPRTRCREKYRYWAAVSATAKGDGRQAVRFRKSQLF